MGHLALIIYQWGDHEQNQLLAKCIAPALDDLRLSSLIDYFWLDRFDARGPHLYLLFVASPPNRKTIEDQMSTRLNAYFAATPSTVFIPEDKLVEIHRGCQGKALCGVDRLPGMGANNTYCFFDHPEHGYPLEFSRPGAGTRELWRGLSALSEWSICELINHRTVSLHGSALRFIHAVDRELRNDPEWATRFWRYAASRLLFLLSDDRFADPRTFIENLTPWIGHRNMKTFAMAWDTLDLLDDPFPVLPNLVALSRSEVDRERFSEFTLLRMVVHCGLAQLGLPVRLRAPLFVFAMVQKILQPGATLRCGD